VLATPVRAHVDVALGARRVPQLAHEARLVDGDLARDDDDARVDSHRFVEPLEVMSAADERRRAGVPSNHDLPSENTQSVGGRALPALRARRRPRILRRRPTHDTRSRVRVFQVDP
jgi:hypothetical protein